MFAEVKKRMAQTLPEGKERQAMIETARHIEKGLFVESSG